MVDGRFGDSEGDDNLTKIAKTFIRDHSREGFFKEESLIGNDILELYADPQYILALRNRIQELISSN